MAQLSIGLPKMRVEVGERRDFLPDFVAMLLATGANVVVEEGVGAGMTLGPDAYRRVAPGVVFGSHAAAYAQDVVLVLRCPDDEDLRRLRPGACLMSMLHYNTRPQRVALLRQLGVEAISLDSLKDDLGRRTMENFRAVAWNGVEVAFQILAKCLPDPGLESPQRRPLQVTLLGAGALGSVVLQAAVRYGDRNLWQRLASSGVPGVQLSVVDYDVTRDTKAMQTLLSTCNLLIDASQRPDPGRPIIPNAWIGHMPAHAVLLDLAVDPYNCQTDPPSLKGIEGVVGGNLDQYTFAPDDPAFDALPACVDSTNRRWSVSCYSWPGVHPRPCMELYATQLTPLMQALIRAGGPEAIDPKGPAEHRVMARAQLSRYP